MIERAIKKIEPSTGDDEKNKLNEVAKSFTNKDSINQQDIQEIAENIAFTIKERLHLLKKIGEIESDNDNIEVIIDTLNPREMLGYCTHEYGGFFSDIFQLTTNKYRLIWKDTNGKEQQDLITTEELEPFLEKIRTAVLNKLSGILPPNITARIIKETKERVSKLNDGKFYKKEGTRYNHNGREAEVEALKFLYSLPEKSPFIFYGIEILDKKHAATISKAFNITNIKEELEKPIKPSFNKILDYLQDIIEGHTFLIRNNLILIDSSVRNLGINQNTGTGILFDMDGIRKLGSPLNFYSVPPEYISPEYISGNPATEANIVWELGISMEKISKYYPSNKDYYRKDSKTPKQLIIFSKLFSNMINKNPSKRPTLQQVKEKLEEIRVLG